MQKIFFKSVEISKVIFFKITSSLLFISLLLSTPLFAENTLSNEDDSKIIISGGANIFDHEDSLNDKILNKESKENAIIFVTEDAIISNIGAFSNAEIRKLEQVRTSNKPSQKKTSQKKASKKIATAKIKYTKKNKQRTFYNSITNSGLFSQNSNEKFVFLSNINQFLSKAIIPVVAKKENRKLYFSVIQSFKYLTPNLRISRFLGKYSIRPPTFYG